MKKSILNYGIALALAALSTASLAQSTRAQTTRSTNDAWWPTSTYPNSEKSEKVVDIESIASSTKLSQISAWGKVIRLTLKQPQIVPPGVQDQPISDSPNCHFYLKNYNSTAYTDFAEGREFRTSGAEISSGTIYFTLQDDKTLGSIYCSAPAGGSNWNVDMTLKEVFEKLKPLFDAKIDFTQVKRVLGAKPASATKPREAIAYDFESSEGELAPTPSHSAH